MQGSRRDKSGAVIAGAAAGFVGGFLAAQGVQNFNEVRARRQEFNDDGVEYIREPGRTIVREDDRIYIAHDENQRFRELGFDVRSERQGAYDTTFYTAPDGSRIYNYTDGEGRLVRRVRQFPDGREVILIDNRYAGPERNFRADVIDLPPPPIDLPPDRYIVDAGRADERLVYDTLVAPPVAPLPRRYTLDQIRYSQDLRLRMRSVDLNTITFDTGSWTVSPDDAGKLAILAGTTLIGFLFINLLPDVDQSDTLVLSCIHLLLFLWSVLGFSFTGDPAHEAKRLAFLKYNGDLVVMATVILIACGITTGLTIGLFSLIGFNIEEFYFQNIVVFGLPAVPLVATWLIQTNPMLCCVKL